MVEKPDRDDFPYERVIGLEVHAQLRSETKIFCRCPTRPAEQPNRHTCPRCLGLPGTLPVLNRRCVTLALKAALALQCTVHPSSQFARKSYFYPDLPKGYQISQYDRPLATGGRLALPEGPDGEPGREIAIRRLHLEEDAGKSRHGQGGSLIDFNRCGVPLIEIVSEPELRSPEEATAYLEELRRLLRYTGVCDGNMEEGSFRCDANLSLRPRGSESFGTRTEVKNLNSFRHLRQALEFESRRQAELLDRGEAVTQETRLYDPESRRTVGMRSKEESADYRYFPDPDLPGLEVDEAWLQQVAGSLPELPRERRQRFRQKLGLSAYDAAVLTAEQGLADYYEKVLAAGAPPKPVANWVMIEVLRLWDGSAGPPPLTADRLAELLLLVERGEVGSSAARTVWEKLLAGGESARRIVEQEGLSPLTELEPVVQSVLAAHPREVVAYRAGKQALIGFFVGQAMRATRGRADAVRLQELLRQRLDGR